MHHSLHFLKKGILLLPLTALPSFFIRLPLVNALDILLIAAVLSWAPELRKWMRKPTPLFWLGCMLIIAGGISVLISADRQVAAGALKSWIILPVLYSWVIAAASPSLDEIRKSLLWSLTTLSIFGFISIATVSDRRLTSLYDNPNFFALIAVPILLLSLPLCIEEVKKRSALYPSLFLISSLAFFLTKSLGGMLGLLSGLIVYLVASYGKHTIARILVGLVAVVMCAVPLITPLNATNSIFIGRSKSLPSRTQIWKTALLIISETPLAGIGLRQFGERYIKEVPRVVYPPLEWGVPQPHNFFLATWVNLGLLGVLTLGAGFFIAARATTQPELLGALAALFGHGMIDTHYFQNDLSLFIWVLLALCLSPVITNKQKGQK